MISDCPVREVKSAPASPNVRSITVPSFEANDGARLYYEQQGSGPVALLVHGGTGTGAYDWEFQRDPLARSFTVVVPDLRGHGHSSDPGWRLGLDAIGDDLLAVIEAIGERPTAIIAFSLGATAVMRLLAARPDLADALVVISAAWTSRPDLLPAILNGPWPIGLIRLRHEHAEAAHHWAMLRRALAESWASNGDLGEQALRRISIPTLVVCGDRDPLEPVASALRLSRTLPAGELLVLPRCGHFVSRQQPAELTFAIERFLAHHLPREHEHIDTGRAGRARGIADGVVGPILRPSRNDTTLTKNSPRRQNAVARDRS